MPKTLAALPKSQYATLLLDVSGKLLVKEEVFFRGSLDVMFLPICASGEEGAGAIVL